MLFNNNTQNIIRNITNNITHNITRNNTTNDQTEPTNYVQFDLTLFLITISGAFICLNIYHRALYGNYLIPNLFKIICKKKVNRVVDVQPEYQNDRRDNYEEKIIPKVKVIKVSMNNELQFCSICQEETYNTIKINCNHYFCKDCIDEYLKVSIQCPNCKKEIKKIYENKN